MARRTLTETDHQNLIAAFRERPGNISYASRQAGVDWDTAKKAWDVGWDKRSYARVPIRQMLADEVEVARAERIRREESQRAEEEERRIAARADAIIARAEEARGAQLTRKNALNMAVVSAKLVMVADVCAEAMMQRLGMDPKTGVPDPTKVAAHSLNDLRTHTALAGKMMRDQVRVMELALAIERIVTGEPIAVVGVRVEDMSPERMIAELKGLTRTLDRVRRVSGLSASPRVSTKDEDPDHEGGGAPN